MASGGKRKTTMAKLNRESKLRERRLEKQAKKDMRKLLTPDDPGHPSYVPTEGDGPDTTETAAEALADG